MAKSKKIEEPVDHSTLWVIWENPLEELSQIQDWINERITADNIPDELKGVAGETIKNLLGQTSRQAKAIHELTNKLKDLKEENAKLKQKINA